MVGGGRGNGIGRSCGGLLAQTVGKGGHRAGKGRGRRRRRRRRKRRGNRLDARDTLMDLVNHSRLEACNGLESAHTDCTESDGKEGETRPIWRSDLCNHTPQLHSFQVKVQTQEHKSIRSAQNLPEWVWLWYKNLLWRS